MENELIKETEEKMLKSLENLDKKMGTVRAGRANPSSLDGVQAEYYGVMTPLKQLATISIPEARQLCIKPFDKSSLQSIEKAIYEERRKELTKQVKALAEEAKVAIRNIRHEALDDAKALELSEDELKGVENRIQDLVNNYNKKIDDALKLKEQDLLTV